MSINERGLIQDLRLFHNQGLIRLAKTRPADRR